MKINVKDLRVYPISSSQSKEFVERTHYSKKSVPNSNIHFGVFYENHIYGVMTFGPPMDKNKSIKLVVGTEWNEMCELNRMAFSELLPKNSESRCLSYAIRALKKKYPQLKWIQSFSDATQSGDGCIYRATGFFLTQIKENKQILRLQNGEIVARKSLDNKNFLLKYGSYNHSLKKNASAIPGFQLRYIYLYDKNLKINCDILSYDAIEKVGAGMYRGKKKLRIEHETNATGFHPVEGGAVPTDALQK